jgi:hypothetical protein
MTQDEIIEMAKKVRSSGYWDAFDLINFAKLVAEAAASKEREACAKLCEDKHDTWRWDDESDSASGPRDCAKAIRARGEK